MKKLLSIILLLLFFSGVFIYWKTLPKVSNTPKSQLSESDAKKIAEKTCIKGGEALTSGIYDPQTKVWKFEANLNSAVEGCKPLCLVSDENKTAEISNSCSNGQKPEESSEVLCPQEYRNGDVCTFEYQPVCGLVEVQCVKAPCNPVREDFDNVCAACSNSLVKSYYEGTCNY